MEWLDGFEVARGRSFARLVNETAYADVDDLGSLATKGVPSGAGQKWRALTSDFSTWNRCPAERYLAGFSKISRNTEQHDVFSFKHRKVEFLVPALVLLRGLFPLIPDAFEYLFTPRSLETLCVPLERNGHWSVALPDFRGLYRGRFRPATVESLTWASIFPSARRLWASVHENVDKGRMGLDLPQAKIHALPVGVRRGAVVYVTSFAVSAVLALEAPFEFATNTSNSFLWNLNATPLAPGPNAYYQQTDPPPETNRFALTDDEWAAVSKVCFTTPHAKGRKPRDSRRAIADGLLLRIVTARPWAEIATSPLTAHTLQQHWWEWRKSGKLARLLAALRPLRQNASYLDLT